MQLADCSNLLAGSSNLLLKRTINNMFKGHRTRKRVDISLKTEIIFKGKGHEGYISNLSARGMKWYLYGDVIPLSPGEKIKMKFQLPSGQSVDLYCKVKWAHKKSPSQGSPVVGIDSMPEYTEAGLEIIDPTPQYKDFFKSLHE